MQMIIQVRKKILPLIIRLNKIVSKNRSQEDPSAILGEVEIILLIKTKHWLSYSCKHHLLVKK